MTFKEAILAHAPKMWHTTYDFAIRYYGEEKVAIALRSKYRMTTMRMEKIGDKFHPEESAFIYAIDVFCADRKIATDAAVDQRCASSIGTWPTDFVLGAGQ